MAYYEIHCPRCGRTMTPDQLAFDFGAIINDDLENQRKQELGGRDEWYDLTKFNLCLYLTLNDLIKDYGFTSTPNGTYKGRFVFTTEHLAQQILKLSLSQNPNISIEMLTQNTDTTEYNNLTEFMAKAMGQDKHSLAEDIQEICVRILRYGNVPIAAFNVEVEFTQDDQGNRFANRLTVRFDNRTYRNYTEFICTGDDEEPCGKVLYGHAGRYKEIVIGLAGTARVGKTAYLASLLASILRKGDYVQRLGHDQNAIVNIAYADKSYENFQRDLIDPFLQGKKITKTANITEGSNGDREAIPLFSLTFSINKRNYIFTFVDMPGEVYDDSEGENQNLISNGRRIILSADMIWLCIAPAQVKDEGNFGGDQVNTELMTAFTNIQRTMEKIQGNRKIPTAVLITRADEGAAYGIYDNTFNPFPSPEHPFAELTMKNQQTPWVNVINGHCALYYDNMKWHLDRAARFLALSGNLPNTISGIFGHYTPFAVAAYGRVIDGLNLNTNQNEQISNLPTPSMIEGPFLWTLAVLDMIPVFKEEVFERERSKMLFLKEKYTVVENVRVSREEKYKIFYS